MYTVVASSLPLSVAGATWRPFSRVGEVYVFQLRMFENELRMVLKNSRVLHGILAGALCIAYHPSACSKVCQGILKEPHDFCDSN